MNERIKKLAEQANGPNPFFGTLKNQMTLLGDDAVEKFAELIIRECVGIVADAVNHREPASTYVGKIKEHFGVE